MLTCAHPVRSAGANRCARRARGEAADGSASPHQRFLQYAPKVARLSRSAGRSRRVGRYNRAVRPAVGWPRRGSLAARSTARLPLLPPPLRPRPLWPLAEPPSSRQSASSSFSTRPCDRDRPAGHPGRRHVAHVRVRPASTKCVMLSRGGDHLSGGTLDGGHGGSVRPSGGGPRACMAAQECSGVSDRFA